MTDQAPVDIQLSRKFFLCVTVLDAEAADAFLTPLYVVCHIKVLGDARFEIGDHGYFAIQGCHQSEKTPLQA